MAQRCIWWQDAAANWNTVDLLLGTVPALLLIYPTVSAPSTKDGQPYPCVNKTTLFRTTLPHCMQQPTLLGLVSPRYRPREVLSYTGLPCLPTTRYKHTV
jgi:hypothetical protein